MEQLADNLWLMRYPLSVLGTRHGRNVTVIRLASGQMILHSMAPFSPADIEAIRALGSPGWLVEGMLLHDTYARDGRDLFPGVPFVAPPGFSEIVKFSVLSLDEPPAEWSGEIEVMPVAGAPKLREYAMLHRPSRTLIVADLIFNFRADERGWDRFFHRHLAGLKRYPGMSRIFRWCIKDRAAFESSIARILDRDFDRIVVGHGNMIASDGKALLRQGLADAGFSF